MGLNLDPTWLFLSLFPGAIGFVLFVYGKKQGRWPHMVTGMILSVYTIFTPNLISMVLVGTGLCVGLWLAVRAGW